MTPCFHAWKKNPISDILNLGSKSLKSCHVLSRLITPYHSFSLMFNRKRFFVTTLDLVPKLWKSYHILSHLITFYHTLFPYVRQKSDNFKFSTKTSKQYHAFSHLPTSYGTLLPHVIPRD